MKSVCVCVGGGGGAINSSSLRGEKRRGKGKKRTTLQK